MNKTLAVLGICVVVGLAVFLSRKYRESYTDGVPNTDEDLNTIMTTVNNIFTFFGKGVAPNAKSLDKIKCEAKTILDNGMKPVELMSLLAEEYTVMFVTNMAHGWAPIKDPKDIPAQSDRLTQFQKGALHEALKTCGDLPH